MEAKSTVVNKAGQVKSPSLCDVPFLIGINSGAAMVMNGSCSKKI